jgi:hypothetical protein
MNSRELISNLQALGPQDHHVLFTYLADHVHEARLNDGICLLDRSDFAAWLRELAREARNCVQASTRVSVMPGLRTSPRVISPAAQRRYDHVCPDCDHEHRSREECGFYLGEGRFCHCESKAAA